MQDVLSKLEKTNIMKMRTYMGGEADDKVKL
jgi:hypothetical protein